MLQTQLRLWTLIKRDTETILDRPGGYNLTKGVLKSRELSLRGVRNAAEGKSGKKLIQLCRGLGGGGLSHESLRKRQVTYRADGRLANG